MQDRIEINIDTVTKDTPWYVAHVVDAFTLRLQLQPADRADIRDSVKEAVQNCFFHAYPGEQKGKVTVSAATDGETVAVLVEDNGVGIPDVKQAMQPMFTTGNPEIQAGLGFSIMLSSMDKVKVMSEVGKGTSGTSVFMRKKCAVGEVAAAG